jgi:hypothetical protein
VIAIVAFVIAFAVTVTHAILKSTSNILENIYSKKRIAFKREIPGKEHYSAWMPDERAIWRKTDLDAFFLEAEIFTLLTRPSRSYSEFSYKIDSGEQRNYLWRTHMFMDRAKCEFSDFRTSEQAQEDAARISAGIEASRRAI